MQKVALPALAVPAPSVSPQLFEAKARWIRRAVAELTRHSQHRCFYQSYVTGSILRRAGVPLVLNIGLHTFEPLRGARGHCWLTLDDAVYGESAQTQTNYPYPMGSNRNGVRFWVGSIPTPEGGPTRPNLKYA